MSENLKGSINIPEVSGVRVSYSALLKKGSDKLIVKDIQYL